MPQCTPDEVEEIEHQIKQLRNREHDLKSIPVHEFHEIDWEELEDVRAQLTLFGESPKYGWKDL